MSLTDALIRVTKVADKEKKFFDGGGLFLLVTPTGGKWWRLKYRFAGKEKLLSLGTYPDTSLKDARERRDEAKRLLASGVDPSEHRKASKIEAITRGVNTFQAVALEWFEVKRSGWKPGHAKHIMTYFTTDVFPWMGNRPIAEITPPELLRVVRRVEKRAIPTAHRVLGVCGEVFRYAIVNGGRADRDPSADLRGQLKPKPKEKNRASVTNPDKVGELLRTLDNYAGGFHVRCALRLAPYLFCRPGELVAAEWKDIDLEKREWTFQASKVDIPHIVPLSSQAVEILQELHHMTGGSRYVFAQAFNFDKHISTDTVRLAIRSCGVPRELFTTHGTRAMARTLLHEVLHFKPEVIERALSHEVKDPNGRAYNRTMFLDDRRRMMQEWADYLDGLKTGNIRLGKVA
ncbi:MAG TPA: integrase arm-type DNA-binding domain-containing protein [Candidatus Ozemobacteraceae bacterium]|nr:integrase arm-type DNA-binding domain-containing protein [Candidatus Ozemobacteraceae bacterium]